MSASDATTHLFDSLCSHVHAEPDRRGEVHIDCPYCGKEAKRGQTHFRFSVRGFKCWVCGESGSLKRLAEQLDAPTTQMTPRSHQMTQEPPKPRYWQSNPSRVLESFLAAPDRLQLWTAYKPLTLESIARWRLGVGRLPFVDEHGRTYEGKYRRLILPTFAAGKLVALDGRACHPQDDGAKWICATGSSKTVLFNGDLLTRGCTVIICENKVDCILAMQETPGIVAVAGGGASWREAWTAQIAAARPADVIVWTDNDLAGQPNKETYPVVLAEWRARIVAARARNPQLARQPFPRPPRPIGPRIATELAAAGVPCALYHWPAGTPPKYDLGSALMESRRVAA